MNPRAIAVYLVLALLLIAAITVDPGKNDRSAASTEPELTSQEGQAFNATVDEILRMTRPLGPTIVPPSGVAWQLYLARSARLGAPPPGTASTAEIAGTMMLATVQPQPLRPIHEILDAKVEGGDRTVRAVLREVRELAHSKVHRALPRLDVETAHRVADNVVFGTPPLGLRTEELDALLSEKSGG